MTCNTTSPFLFTSLIFLLSLSQLSASTEDHFAPTHSLSTREIARNIDWALPFPVTVVPMIDGLALLYPRGYLLVGNRLAMDSRTLLSLFFSSQWQEEIEPSWAYNGGQARIHFFSPEGDSLSELNTETGKIRHLTTPFSRPNVLLPTSRGGVYVIEKRRILFYRLERNRFLGAIPLGRIPTLALVTLEGEACLTYEILSGRLLRFSGESLRREVRQLAKPPGIPRALAGTQEQPFLISRGRLLSYPEGARRFTVLEEGLSEGTTISTDPRGTRLYLADPRRERIVLFAPSSMREQELPFPPLSSLLENITSAGRILAEKLLLPEAESFYRWSLPLLQKQRSADPFDRKWLSLLREVEKHQGELEEILSPRTGLSVKIRRTSSSLRFLLQMAPSHTPYTYLCQMYLTGVSKTAKRWILSAAELEAFLAKPMEIRSFSATGNLTDKERGRERFSLLISPQVENVLPYFFAIDIDL